MNRLHFVFILWFTIALTACTQSEPEAASTTSQETAPATPLVASAPIEVTRIVVEVTRIVGTAEPSPTPAACTPYPAGMTVAIIPTAAKSFTLEISGLQEHEELIIIVGGQTAAEGAEITYQLIPESVVDGRYTNRYNLSSYEIPHWQGKVIHARGVACFEFSLPLLVEEQGRLVYSASPIPLDPADYPPATAPYYVPGGDF